LVHIAADGAAITASAAIGIALCPEDGRDLETLLKRSDEDMYLRKQELATDTDPPNLS
jgi:predicted signal transduction protein with EAL and GGDEF domain